MKRLTILICTHNRETLLSRALDWINQAIRPDKWSVDILVAANACSDGTHRLLEDYRDEQESAGRLPLNWIEVPNPGKTHALNAALEQIDSEMVAFVDDDHRIDRNYLRAICDAADRFPEAEMFCGRILPDWDGSEPPWVHEEGKYRIYPLPVPRFDLGDESCEIDISIAIPGGGNLAFRSRIFARVGPFDHAYGPKGHNLAGGEDQEWVMRALERGIRLRYNPDMIQYHYVDGRRLTLAYMMRKAYQRTRSTLRLNNGLTGHRIPPAYLYRKILGYVAGLLASRNRQQARFYLVRLSAAMGEMVGYLRG